MSHEHEDWQEPLNENDDLGDTPEFVEEIELTEEPPSPEEADEFFSDMKNVKGLLRDIDAEQRAAALGKAAEARAKEIYAQQEEKQRRQSPHRVQLSGEALNPETGMWEKMHDDD